MMHHAVKKHTSGYVWRQRAWNNFVDGLTWLWRFTISIGTTIALGALAFAGVQVLGFGLVWSIAAFVFAIAIEALVYYQNIHATYTKIKDLFSALIGSTQTALKHSLAVLKLDELSKEEDYKDVPLIKTYLAHKKVLHDLNHIVEEDCQPIDWIPIFGNFSARWRLRRKIQQQQAALNDIENFFVKMVMQPNGLPPQYAHLFGNLNIADIQEWLTTQTAERSIDRKGSAFIIFLALGSALSSFLAAYTAMEVGLISVSTAAAVPALLLPLAIFAGVGYGLMLINSLMVIWNNRVVADWWQSVRKESAGNNFKAFFAFVFSVRFLVFALASLAAAATFYTWWGDGQETAENLLQFSEDVANGLSLMVGLVTMAPTAHFDYLNGMKSWKILTKEQKKEAWALSWFDSYTKLNAIFRLMLFPLVVVITLLAVVVVIFKRIVVRMAKDYAAFNKKNKSQHWWVRFCWLLNPVRIVNYLFDGAFRGGVFVAHVASIGATADKLADLPNWATMIISALMELLTDVHYLLHDHDHDDHKPTEQAATASTPLLAGLAPRVLSLNSSDAAQLNKPEETLKLPDPPHDHPDFAGVLLIIPKMIFRIAQFIWDLLWCGFTQPKAAWKNSFGNPHLNSEHGSHSHHGHGHGEAKNELSHSHSHNEHDHEKKLDPELEKVKLVTYVATAYAQQERLAALSHSAPGVDGDKPKPAIEAETGIQTKTRAWSTIESEALTTITVLDQLPNKDETAAIAQPVTAFAEACKDQAKILAKRGHFAAATCCSTESSDALERIGVTTQFAAAAA